jgi:hypothetical protein
MLHERARADPGGFSPLTPPADRRINELDDWVRSLSALVGTSGGTLGDSLRVSQQRTQSLGSTGRLTRGLVVHAIPYLNWYKVQCGDGNGFIAACKAEDTGLVPCGPRRTGPLPPGSSVLVFIPNGLHWGVILGVLPPLVARGEVVCPDWIVQGGNSGMKREEAHKFPIKGLSREGGTMDFSAHRPQDATAFEHGWITPTGLAITIDDWLVQVRANEMCGLFLSWYDSWCRLAGQYLRVESSVHEEEGVDDEGEAHYFRGIAAYPWEALGLYDRGTPFTQEFSDREVQYDRPRGKIDLMDGAEDVQPCYRYQEYGGYKGQGHFRTVMRPGRSGGRRLYRDNGDPPDDGLFREHIGLDGSYSLVSAKRLYIGKRCKLVVPFQKRLPEDQNGDDADRNNYRFSGVVGSGGEQHRIKDIQLTGPHRHMRLAAGVNDVIAYLVNWQALHPFHYHRGDYTLKQENELTSFSRIQENVPFADLADRPFVPDAQPRKLHIDQRYGQVDYFERESFLVFHDDGTVQLGAGCGEHILLGGGDVVIEAPGKVKLLPGTDLLGFADQICLRARGSFDASSSEKDVRLKAERNMQLLSGNGGRGGTLIENKAKGRTQMYRQRYGEDVIASGVIIKCDQSVGAILSKEVYLRSASDGVFIDADKGRARLNLAGDNINVFTPGEVNFYYGPSDSNSTVRKVYSFGKSNAIFDEVKLLLGGKLISYKDGGIVVRGGVYGTKSFATAGVMADKKGMFLGKVPDGFATSLESTCAAVVAAAQALRTAGTAKHRFQVAQRYYQPTQLGSDDTIQDVHFSFRDPPTNPGKQYRTEQLKWLEARWMAMSRTGLGSGGRPWDEKPVIYQGEQTYPWPGRRKWLEEPGVFLKLKKLNMFDTGAGHDMARPGPYEDPKLEDWEAGATMAANYKLIR